MVKRGYDIKSFANKMGYSVDQTMNVLGGFISSSIIEKASKALKISETAINHVTLNSWDLENNFGYFLQKIILERKENIYSIAEKININYCDLKAIVSGARNIRDDEFDKIALGLNLDPVELRKNAPSIIEGDDKYIAYNFLKWFNESGSTYQDCNDTYKGIESIIYNIRHDNVPSNLDIIKLMQITGLSKEKLRAPLSDDEINEIKSFRKTPGRRAKTKDTFNSYIREILKQNNLSMHEFADLLGLHPDALKYMMRKARLREDIKNNFLEILNLDSSILKKFKVVTYKFNPNAQNKSKKNNPETTIEETNNIMDNDSKETKYDISYDARVAAVSIFINLYRDKFRDPFYVRNDTSLYNNFKNKEFKDYFINEMNDIAEKNNVSIGNLSIGHINSIDHGNHISLGEFKIKITADNVKIYGKPELDSLKESYTKNYEFTVQSKGQYIHPIDAIDYSFMDKVSAPPYPYNFDIDFREVQEDNKPHLKNVEYFNEIDDHDNSSMIPNMMPEYNTITGEIRSKNQIVDVDEDREFMMEELDKFLRLFESLKEPDQSTLLRIINTIKYNDDLAMENIPASCFEIGAYAEFKKIEYIIKLTGLEKK